MPFSPSFSLDCMNLQGIGTFGGIGSERIEFGTTLLELDGVGALEGCGKGGGSRIGCGKASSKLVVALSFSSSSSSNCSSMFRLVWDVLDSSPTSTPLSKVIGSSISNYPVELELESSLCSCISQ